MAVNVISVTKLYNEKWLEWQTLYYIFYNKNKFLKDTGVHSSILHKSKKPQIIQLSINKKMDKNKCDIFT